MTGAILKLEPDGNCSQALCDAAACLAAGGLVVFPTETVYGIGVNALDNRALERLRRVKGRDANKPFTVHIGSRREVDRFVPALSDAGRRLIAKAWPGPLTVVFPVPDPHEAPVIRESSESRIASLYHEGTIGIRCPDHAVASAVLTQAGVPIVAASANPAGRPPPISADDALAALADQADLVLDAGRTQYARPSTVVRLDDDGYTLLREGVLDDRAMRRLMAVGFLIVCTGNTCRSPMAAGLLRRLLAERLRCDVSALEPRGYRVSSASAAGLEGEPASSPAIAVMRQRGVDLSGHRSKPLTLDAIRQADYIWTMTAGHLRAVTAMSPAAADRSRLLDHEDIEDPIGSGEAQYARCADRIEAALRRQLEEMRL